jgi:uncharacterized protein YfaS (alpha-2-macroglobulin family)
MIRKYWKHFLLGLLLALGINACGVFNQSTEVKPLPEVAPLVTPQLPNWIEDISPVGEAEPLNQIRIKFKEPLIPVEALGSQQQKDKLEKFEIFPELPGEFRFLTPSMVGFQPAQAFPKAARIRVTVKAGLADLKNNQLAEDLAWTFNTEPIKLTNLPTTEREYGPPNYLDVKPTIEFTSNVGLDLDSLRANLALEPEGNAETIVNFEVKPVEEAGNNRENPEERFNPNLREWRYSVTPETTLPTGTKYSFKINSGLRPQRGNLPSQTAFISKVETYSALSFQQLKQEPGYGRFKNGDGELEFNNPVVPDSAKENISVEPAPKEGVELAIAYENYNVVSLNPWALEPDTTYTVTIGENLKDKFGQTLGKPVTVQYETGDLAGNIEAPSGLNIFPSNLDLELNLTAVNLPESQYKAAYKVVQPTELIYADSAYPNQQNYSILSQPQTWQTFPISQETNQPTKITIPIRERLNGSAGMLAYGIQARTRSYQNNGETNWEEPTIAGLVQLTNLGVFAQWFPESGLVRVNHLDDGSPAQASVEIYQSQLRSNYRPNPTPCATGQTDSNGFLNLSNNDLRQCANGQRFNQAPELLVIAKENNDWSFTRTESYSGAYGYGISANWDEAKPLSRGTIFSDRQLYQPGEKVWLTGAIYYLENGTIKQGKNANYQVTMQGPDGNEIDLGTQTTNEYGTFSLELPLENTQPLGFYNVTAKGENDLEITGQFRVAEFKPPNFKTELSLNKNIALPGETVEANAESKYLFGAPVAEGKATYYVTRNQTNFTPKDWEEFSFGRQWFWPEERPNVPNNVLQTNAVLDTAGTDSQTVKVAEDLPYPMTYQVDVEISDVSNLSVADSQTFTALPSDKLIGLKTKFVAEANKEFPIEFIVTDSQGKAIAGQRVQIQLQKMDYSSVTRVLEGSRTGKNQVEYETVAETDARSGNEPTTVKLAPPESGSYRIRANFANSEDEATATDTQIWATGAGGVYWGDRDTNTVEVKLDKDTYQPGETATALIQSPYEDAQLYFAVVRDKPLYQTITTVTGGAPEIQFQVTQEMVPNAAVEAVLVRQGPPLEQVEPGSIDSLSRIGFAPFNIDLGDKYLQVEVAPRDAEIAPGAVTAVELQLKNSDGQPATGQLAVMVVNDAVLQLTGYRPPDLVKTVYAEQSVSTRFSDNRPDTQLVNFAAETAKGWGYGGGRSASAASTRVRTDFKPWAYYNGAVSTDNNGLATVSFKLPDDLTTWRVMAVATDGDLHFGNGEGTVIATKPLLSNPVLPQFVRKGDRFEGGLSVTNNTGKGANLTIKGELGDNIEFVAKRSKSEETLQTKQDATTKAYRFPMEANRVGEGKVRFVTETDGRLGDAFEVSLPVQSLSASETVVESGTTSDRLEIPLNINQNVVSDVGGLEVMLASTLIPEIAAPAKQVLGEQQFPFLEPAASQLAIAANLQILGNRYGQAFGDFEPTQEASQALEKLAKLQQPDGGFAYYPGMDFSDPFVTPYAAEAIAQATEAFPYLVRPEMVNQVKNYLANLLADPGQYEYCDDELCKSQMRLDALIALAELGDRRSTYLADIYERRDELDLVAEVQLARYLSTLGSWQQQGRSMFDRIQEGIYETGRNATVNLPRSWGWMNSQTAAQAEALRLFVARDASQVTSDRLLQSLLSLRRDGTWQTTYDNAKALTALVDYSNAQATPPNFAATASLEGQRLVSAQFEGYENPKTSVTVAMDALPEGNSQLILDKSGEGTLHYLVEYSYRLPGNQPGRFAGLRVSREIRPVGSDEVLQRIDLAMPEKPLTVEAGRVFDIGLEIVSDRSADRVLIKDALPAGFEAIDNSFQTSTASLQAGADSWAIGYQQIYRDRVEAYADRLEPGAYRMHYLVRSVTPGTFLWPGAEARLQYAPEEFGRSASATLEVR